MNEEHDPMNSEQDSWPEKDRRRYVRIKKHFILSYFMKDDPSVKHDLSQLKNISLGGMCFVTSKAFEPQTKLGVELKTPYLADTTHLEGTVLESHEKLPTAIYETRMAFDPLSPQAEFVLKKVIDYFKEIKGELHNYE
jgi:hypothetical protein